MPNTRRCILVVEDELAEREALSRVLRLEGYDVLTACDPVDAQRLADRAVDLVISDLCMGRHSGIDFLCNWRQQRPYTPFILLTGFGTVNTAVAAMKSGADDFLTKPVDPVQLLGLIRNLLNPAASNAEEPVLARINAGLSPKKIIGRSSSLAEVCGHALRAAQTTSTVLILGESGTGKELIAEALHRHSSRCDASFVVVNMAAIPESLVESELFGHVKGAFTSATANRIGRFEAAHGGTLFIDEIGDFPLHMQAKLLRVLETRTINPIGSNRVVPVDVRVVAATSRPLAKMCDSGAFREDLYFRLNVISIQLAPLRERRQDIALLTQHFVKEFASSFHRKTPRVAPELLRELERLNWPGNIRQLRNCLERMCVLCHRDVLTPQDLPPDIRELLEGAALPASSSRLESLERSAILQALEQFDGNRTRAASFLGISVRTLQRKLHHWGMMRSDNL